MVGAVATVVGNYHFGLPEAGYLLNSTIMDKTASSKVSFMCKYFGK